jgi:hypothetical protein
MPGVLDITRDYFAALEGGATGEALAAFYAPEVIQEEFPNRLSPGGASTRSSPPRDGAGK